MCKTNLLRCMLSLLLGLVCNVVWAQTEYVVSANTGTFNKNWASEWAYTTSDANPAALKLITTNSAGNMQGSGAEMHLYSGTAKSSPYRLQVSLPYQITGYSFKYSGAADDKTITIDEEVHNVTAEVQTIEKTGLATQAADFTLAGNNNKVTLTEFKVYIQKVEIVTVTYNYIWNGISFATENVEAAIGYAFPAPAKLPYGFSANAPAGEVTEADNGKTYDVACTVSLPFEYADSYANITKWYYMQMHSNNKRYIEYIADGNYLEWADASLPESGSKKAYAWAFVGDPVNGFKLYNRAAGSSVAVKSTGDGNPGMAADGTAFKPAASGVSGDQYFCLQYPGGKYLNAQNGKVAHWGANDAGSTFLLSEYDVTEEPIDALAEAKTTAKAAVAVNESTLSKAIGYYSYTANGTKLYTLDDVNAAIEACETLEAITAITESYSVNLPEAGKMYRFGYNYGNETGVLYLQSTNSSVKGLEMAAGQGEGSIFLVEEIDGNLRLKSISTGKYLKEDGNHRGLYDEGNNVTFTAGAALGQIKIQATSYLHANTSNGNYFVDHCGGDGCAQHNFVAVEVVDKYAFPENGKTYYIYSDTYHNGSFVNRYLYADDSSLKLNTALQLNDNYKWTCTVNNDGSMSFRNGSGKYLGYKVMADEPYNFAVDSTSVHNKDAVTLYAKTDSRYIVVHNDGSQFNHSTITYNQETEAYCTDFIFIESENVNLLSVVGDSKVKASATWNNETKALPASWLVFNGDVIEEPTLSIEVEAAYSLSGLYSGENNQGETMNISSLDASLELTAKFAPAFLSQNVGDKWINIVRKTDAGHAMFLGSNVAGAKPTFNKKDYTNTGMLWSFVGTADNFKIYNYVSGEALALTPSAASIDDIGDGTEVKMVAAADAQSWHLIEKDGGYAIAPVGNNDWSLNSYGGTDYLGANIKFYGANDGGSHWNFDLIDVENTLSMGVYVDQVLESSPRVAELTLSIDGSTAQTRIEGNVETTATYYLPKGATLSLSSMTYRGYDFGGFDSWADGEFSAEAFCIPEGGLWVYAYYTANDERTLFYSPRDGHPYRIPAIATAPNGDIFAICDYRPCGGDIGNGEVDIVCRISSDNGVTWDDEIVLADGDGGSTNRMETGYGDPAIVVDRESNKILVMMVAGRTVCGDSRWDASKIGVKDAAAVNRAARVYGTLNETTGKWEWTQPEEVTDDIYKLFLDESNNATVTSYFIGSGKICQSRVVKKGEYYRLYCALWTRDQGNRVIYSDDFGGTWNVLGTINDRPAPNGNEPKCEELPDGTVILSSRVGGGRYFNVFTFNDNTYTTGTWGEVANSTTVRDGSGGTNGEIYKVKAIRKSDGQICDVMLQSVPAGSGRTNVTVWYKEMDYTSRYTPATFAADWTVGKQVSQKGSAYSTMIMQADGRIGFFFEEEPSGYCMVYIPYSIEDLTSGLYEASAENKASFLLHAAPKVLALTGVGYPEEDSEVRNDLTKAIEAVNDGNASTEDYEELSDAYEAYITTTDVQMPADGGTYIIYSVLTTDENNFSPSFNVLKYDEQSGVLTVAQKSATDDDAEKFVCRVIDAENKRYAFVNAKNGKYALYYSPIDFEATGKVGEPFAADGGNATGFSSYYNCLSSAENDLYLHATPDVRLGTLAIAGLSQGLAYGGWVTMCVDENGQLNLHNGNRDKHSNVNLVCEANASSVFAFQEVSYPNNVKLNTIKDTDVCLHNIGVGKGIGTFSAPFATLVPEGVTAYYAASKTANGATLAVMEGQAIPAHQGVILVGESGIASSLMVPAKTNGSEIEADATIEGNLFCHTAGTTHVLELGDYVLGNRVNINGEYFTKGIAFYQGTVGTVAGKNKAYIVLGADSQVKAYALDFGGEVTHITGVENTASDAGLPVYDLSGRRVSQLSKGGVYIRGGKKFIVK